MSAPAVDVFSALANPVRRELLRMLRDSGPLPAQHLAAEFSLSRPTVSEHLKVLRDAGMVTEQRHGRNRVYQLQPEPFLGLRDWLTPYEQFWRERLTSFAAMLDEEAGPAEDEEVKNLRSEGKRHMTSPGKIEVDQFLPYPPAHVWRILVDPDRLAQWLMPNDFQPIVGHQFTFRTKPIPAVHFAGTIHCEVLAVEPERLLQITWVDRSGSGLDSVVTWRLEPEGRGTRMLMEHSGFDLTSPFQHIAHRTMGSGWNSSVVASMIKVLEREATFR